MQGNNSSFIDLERIEIEAWADFYNAAKQLDSNRQGIDFIESDSAVVSIVSKSNVLALNRVVGMGLDSKITDYDVSSIIDIYKSRSVSRFFIQLHPTVINDSTIDLLNSFGFRHHNNWIKLFKEAAPIDCVQSELSVQKISHSNTKDFSRIICDSFGWGDELNDWIENIIHRKNWHHYMAFDGNAPAATGSFFMSGEYAWIDFAATVESCRGKGAQAVLLKRRFDDAISLGCKYFVVETAEQTKEKSAPSYRNMIRYGFKEAYVRPNYIFEF